MMEGIDGNVSYGAAIAVKATLLLGLAFGLGFLFRRASASARHFLWALSFALLLALPALTFVSTLEQGLRIPVAVLSPPPQPGPVEATVPMARRGEPATTPEAPEGKTLPLASPRRPFPTATSIWLAVSAILLVRLGLGLLSSLRLRKASDRVSDRVWLDLLDSACERMAVDPGAAALHRTERIPLPMTLGLLRPVILLPASAETYSVARRSAVLLHELAHVRRRDCGIQLLSQIACAVFWWNPLAWVGARHMRLLSERAADDLVLDAGARASDYAHDLLEMARSLHREPSSLLVSVAMAHRSRFEERLLALLDPRLARRAVSHRFVLTAAALAVPLVLLLAFAMPTAATSPVVATASRQTEAEAPSPVASPETPEPEAQEEAARPTTAESSDRRELARAALAQALDDPEPSVRNQALQALVQLGDPSVAPHLEKALKDADPETRAQAAWGLGQMQREQSVPSLVEALKDSEEEVREQAAWALGALGSEAAVATLAATVTGDASPSVREQAAWAMGAIGSGAGVDALAQALADTDADVREQAAWALGAIGDPRAIEPLSRAMKDPDAEVREQAAWAMGAIASGSGSFGDPNPNPNPNYNYGFDGDELEIENDDAVKKESRRGRSGASLKGAVF